MMKNSFFKNVQNSICLLLIVFSSNFYAQTKTLEPAVITNSKPTANEILQALNGGGLTLSNPEIVSGSINKTYSNSKKKGSQIVIFEGGNKANLGMDKGVLFSTGDAIADLKSKNENLSASIGIGSDYKDTDLTNIYKEAKKDVVVYTFDVKLEPHTTALRVAFQFGSEEYPNYVGSQYNDAFGFFVSGPGLKDENGKPATTVNMARNPLNNNVISVNTINYGVFGSSGSYDVRWDLSNSSLYINNGHYTGKDNGSNYYYENNKIVYYSKLLSNNDYNKANNLPKPVYIEYNGLTKLITYDLTGLQGGQTYQFKIAIADSGDTQYDSGVIIQKIQGTTGADVKIEKEVNKTEVHPGEEIEFTLTATNLGPYKGTNTKVTDLLPSGYTFVSATPSKGTYDEKTGVWTIGDLEAVHETATLKVKAIVKLSGDYTNTATIKSNDPDPDSDNNTAVVTPNVTPWPKDCEAPAGAKELADFIKGNKINKGEVYRVSKDTKITGSFIIEAGGELYVEQGVKLKVTGDFTQKGGIVKVCPTGGIDIDGSANFGGANSKDDASITLYDKAYFSVTGSLTHGDPSQQGYFNTGKAVINMYDGAFVEVCGTFTQQSTTYPIVNYRGEGDMNAYFVNKANASGGSGSVISNSNNVVWIAMDKVEGGLKNGNAQWCGPNATKETCPNLWPSGLTNKIEGKCHEAEGIVNGKPSIKLEKTGVFNDINKNGYTDVIDTITYTFKVSNTGNVPLHDVVIKDTKLGTALTITYVSGDVNNDKKLDKEEVWTYTTTYDITKEDVNKKGVYNIATVTASDGKGKNVTSTSTDPNPLPETTPGHPGIDKDCPTCTIVILKQQSLFITNPHIYQRLK
ncbi:DUF11 domain-containing protein [Myroides marinus]|nr:DUF11 domain-containing protein [Myroides marinus]